MRNCPRLKTMVEPVWLISVKIGSSIAIWNRWTGASLASERILCDGTAQRVDPLASRNVTTPRSAVWFTNEIQQVRGARARWGTTFPGRHPLQRRPGVRQHARRQRLEGACFIGAERPERKRPPASKKATSRSPIAGECWRIGSSRSRNFKLDAETMVIIDIDKTALGAKGRNDKGHRPAPAGQDLPDHGRRAGVRLRPGGLREHYNELNRARYHQLTADNQDYLAYVCMVHRAS